MKKMQKMLVALLSVLTIGVGAIGLTACDGFVPSPSDPSASEGVGESEFVSESDIVSESESESESDIVSESESESDSEESSSEIIPDKESEGLEFTLSEDSTYYIWTGMGTCTDEHIVLPSEYEGLPVKETADFAGEYYLDLIIEVMLGSELGYELTEEEVVYYKKMLKPQLEEQGICFVSTPIKSITFSDSIESVGAFGGLEGLEKIHIGKNMILETEFDDEEGITPSFAFCTDLKEITVSEEHERYILIDGNVYAMYYSKALLLAVNSTISKGTVEILPGAFANVTATEIVIPDGVRLIGDFAFAWCRSLTEIVIPDSVTSIGYNAFGYCSSLTEIVIPDSVTSIGGEAFYYCSSLTKVVISKGVIGRSAFENCSSLTEVVIGEGVTTIEEFAFYWCSSLTSVTFENTEGWTVTSRDLTDYDNNIMTIPSADLADPAKAAEYLRMYSGDGDHWDYNN